MFFYNSYNWQQVYREAIRSKKMASIQQRKHHQQQKQQRQQHHQQQQQQQLKYKYAHSYSADHLHPPSKPKQSNHTSSTARTRNTGNGGRDFALQALQAALSSGGNNVQGVGGVGVGGGVRNGAEPMFLRPNNTNDKIKQHQRAQQYKQRFQGAKKRASFGGNSGGSSRGNHDSAGNSSSSHAIDQDLGLSNYGNRIRSRLAAAGQNTVNM